MKRDKEIFLKTELGIKMVECVKSWDMAISILSFYNGCDTFSKECEHAEDVVRTCQSQWEVYKVAIRHFYKIDIYFTSVDDFFGIEMVEDGKDGFDYLIRTERKRKRCLSV